MTYLSNYGIGRFWDSCSSLWTVADLECFIQGSGCSFSAPVKELRSNKTPKLISQWYQLVSCQKFDDYCLLYQENTQFQTLGKCQASIVSHQTCLFLLHIKKESSCGFKWECELLFFSHIQLKKSCREGTSKSTYFQSEIKIVKNLQAPKMNVPGGHELAKTSKYNRNYSARSKVAGPTHKLSLII